MAGLHKLSLMLWQTSYMLVHLTEFVGTWQVSELCLTMYLIKPISDCCVGWSGGSHSLHTMYLHDKSPLLPGSVSPLNVLWGAETVHS